MDILERCVARVRGRGQSSVSPIETSDNYNSYNVEMAETQSRRGFRQTRHLRNWERISCGRGAPRLEHREAPPPRSAGGKCRVDAPDLCLGQLQRPRAGVLLDV